MGHLADVAAGRPLFAVTGGDRHLPAWKSTRLEPIDDETYGALARHFTPQQTIDICLTVGLSNMINRFHATFRTDLDAATTAEAEQGDVWPGTGTRQ